LRSVNQLFYENTADGDYATFFFTQYDDSTRRLRYANCGHLSPLLLRHDNIVGYARNRYWRQLLRKFGGSTLTNSKTTSR
jgi:serine phosphatase RsbU (regulator of sigma subunit)